MSVSASKWGLMARGTTEGGLSARYCLSVSESILADMLVVVVVVVVVEERLKSSRCSGGERARQRGRGVAAVRT